MKPSSSTLLYFPIILVLLWFTVFITQRTNAFISGNLNMFLPLVQSKTIEIPPATTYIIQTFGNPSTLDPALNYESAGATIIEQVYERLIAYNRSDPQELAPQLAAALPTISADGLTYTFTMRDDIRFQNGELLTAEDVAYTFQRGLLQGGCSSPQLLLAEPILGAGTYDISEILFAGDPDIGNKVCDPIAVQAADPSRLLTTCQQVKNAIQPNGNTVTFQLANAWSPFLNTLTKPLGSVMDQQWITENGGWTGDCATWQNFYGVTSAENPFSRLTNGTGPFRFDSFVPDEVVILTRNDTYWRAPAAFARVEIQNVQDWTERFDALRTGVSDTGMVFGSQIEDVNPYVGEVCNYDSTTFDVQCSPTAAPNQPLRRFQQLPATTRSDLMFSWNIQATNGPSYIGSGQLDGNGIPFNFFSDLHVRRAFAYCFDWQRYINEAFNGEAEQAIGVFPPTMLGYSPTGPRYHHSLDLCRDQLALAWGGVLPGTGFRLVFPYNNGNTSRQVVGEILRDSLAQVNANYRIDVVELPWSEYLTAQREGRLPLFVSGWAEDIHDPHNWAHPFFAGVYAYRMYIPETIIDEFRARIDAGLATTSTSMRQQVYEEINQRDYDLVISVRLVTPYTYRYEQRRVQGWYYNPALAAPYYALSKSN